MRKTIYLQSGQGSDLREGTDIAIVIGLQPLYHQSLNGTRTLNPNLHLDTHNWHHLFSREEEQQKDLPQQYTKRPQERQQPHWKEVTEPWASLKVSLSLLPCFFPILGSTYWLHSMSLLHEASAPICCVQCDSGLCIFQLWYFQCFVEGLACLSITCQTGVVESNYCTRPNPSGGYS